MTFCNCSSLAVCQFHTPSLTQTHEYQENSVLRQFNTNYACVFRTGFKFLKEFTTCLVLRHENVLLSVAKAIVFLFTLATLNAVKQNLIRTDDNSVLILNT